MFGKWKFGVNDKVITPKGDIVKVKEFGPEGMVVTVTTDGKRKPSEYFGALLTPVTELDDTDIAIMLDGID